MSRHLAHAVQAGAPTSSRPARTDRLVLVIAAVMVLVLVGGILVESVRARGVEEAPGAVQILVWRGARLLYADAEANLWAWLSSITLALLAVTFAVSALVRRGAGQPWRAMVFLSAVALLLSADEGAMLHETLNEIGTRITDALGEFNAWLVPGVVLVVVAGAVLLRVARGLDRRLRWRLVLAGGVFLAGALGMEAVGAAFALSYPGPDNPWETGTYRLLVGVEEGLEGLGALMALRAALATVTVRWGAGGLSVTPRAGGATIDA